MSSKHKGGASNRGQWTENDVAQVITNPIYAGVGPYPAMIDDDQWIAAVSQLIKERGADEVLRNILGNLRAAFPAP